MSDMQLALDTSVETYYADIARNDIVFYATTDSSPSRSRFGNFMVKGSVSPRDSVILTSASSSLGGNMVRITSDFNPMIEISHLDTVIRDSLMNIGSREWTSVFPSDELGLRDSANVRLNNLLKKVAFSLTRNELDFDKLMIIFDDELDRKNINAGYGFWHYVNDSLISEPDHDHYALSTFSQSNYLPRNQKLVMKYENASLNILKRGMLDLLISLLITGAVIGSLLYLYRVISEQKELAEIKNDLISNITHEFKTPIATISTAIEGIANFNQANDPVKTAKYLEISNSQLKKLNGMVEKVLETASLDSGDLDVSYEPVELVHFTRQIFERFHVIKGDKKLSLQTDLVQAQRDIDPFHMENAISNLVDNALKYGGNEVILKLSEDADRITWEVVDNGGNIEKGQQERIFEKFYRIPKGNLHDVKGFGIGLYYTKRIVEKHEGDIGLEVSHNSTSFTIQI